LKLWFRRGTNRRDLAFHFAGALAQFANRPARQSDGKFPLLLVLKLGAMQNLFFFAPPLGYAI
jgi:hypothetical protein